MLRYTVNVLAYFLGSLQKTQARSTGLAKRKYKAYYKMKNVKNKKLGNKKHCEVEEDETDVLNKQLERLTVQDTSSASTLSFSVGIANLGNTCYVNSVVQCLRSCDTFVKFILMDDQFKLAMNRVEMQVVDLDPQCPKTKLLQKQLKFSMELAALIQQMSIQRETIQPQHFLDACNALNTEFASGMQHDAVQFLDESIACLDDVLQNAQIPLMRDLFMGYYNSILFDDINTSSKKEEFFCLRLPIPKPPEYRVPKDSKMEPDVKPVKKRQRKFVTLQECIEDFGREEIVEGQVNEKEASQSIQKKKLQLVYLPPYLFIQLARFDFDKERLEAWKNQTQVKFSLDNIDLTDCVTVAEEEANKKFVYDVIGVIHHYGQTFGGHYVAFCKTNGIWMKISDEFVRRCVNENAIGTQNAYVLLLKRRQENSQ